jgi:hypothetical protein
MTKTFSVGFIPDLQQITVGTLRDEGTSDRRRAKLAGTAGIAHVWRQAQPHGMVSSRQPAAPARGDFSHTDGHGRRILPPSPFGLRHLLNFPARCIRPMRRSAMITTSRRIRASAS